MFILLCSPFSASSLAAAREKLLSGCEIDYPPFCIVHDDGTADGTYQQVHTKWSSAYDLPGRQIIVGGDAGFPPFEFLDERGRPSGFSVDVTRAVAEAMNLDVVIRLGLWDEVQAGLKNGNIDIIQSMFYLPERARHFDFSPPYYMAHYVAVTRDASMTPPQSIDELSNLRAIIQRGDLLHHYLEGRGQDLTDFVFVESQQEALHALVDGRGDCALLTRLVALQVIADNNWHQLNVAREPLYVADYCYAVAKGNRALLVQFAEGLRMIERSGEYQRIRDKWMAVHEPDSVTLDVGRYVRYIGIPLLLFLLLIMVGVWSLRKQVAVRTGELHERLAYEQLISYVSSQAIAEKTLAEFINDALAAMGKAAKVSRTYIFEYDAVYASASNTYEWCASGITPQKNNFQSVQESDFDWLYTAMQNKRPVAFSDIESVGDQSLRETLLSAQVKALLMVPLFVKDMAWGAIGFDQCDRTRDWPETDVRLLLSLSRIISGVIERHLAGQRLAESEQRFRLLVENSPDAIFVQTGGKFAYLNSTAISLFGATKTSDLLGSPVLERFHPDFHSAIRERVRLLNEERQKVPALDEVCRRLDGSEFHAEVSATPIHYDGQDGALVFVRDISLRKEMEDQLRQTQKMDSIGRLAGGVAHDYNNLLQVILGNAEMAMLVAGSNEELNVLLSEVHKAAQRSIEITRQLLGFARKQTVEPQVLELNHAVDEMLRMLRTLIGENIEVCRRASDAAAKVLIDPGQLNQILVNLCLNARDAISDKGMITIETAVEKVSAGDKVVTGAVDGDYAVIKVSDDGCGMDSTTLMHIFEPFYTTKGVGKGSGLGLSTVYGVVHQNGGFIDVESEAGRGSSFAVYLPLIDRDSSVGSVAVAADDVGGGNGTILLVEDEKSIIKTLEIILSQQGYHVLTASNPAGAIELVKSYGEAIDLLVTDVVMPEMNGRELSERVLELHPGVKCLFMSGYPADVIAHHGVVDEDLEFIQKPFLKDAFLDKVREVLDS